MLGYSNINHDEKTVSYDLLFNFPFEAEVIVNQKDLTAALQKLVDSKKEVIRISTANLEGVKVRDLPFEKVNDVVQRLKVLLTDWEELQHLSLCPAPVMTVKPVGKESAEPAPEKP